MNLYTVVRNEKGQWGDFTSAIVIAKDKLHAEKLVRVKLSESCKKVKLLVEELNNDSEDIISVKYCPENWAYIPK